MTTQLRVLRFDGIHPDTLGHYFSALGILAAVAQRWPDVRGCWRNRRFLLLHETLTTQTIREYLLESWEPTRYERWWGDAQKSDTKAKTSAAIWQQRNRRTVQDVQILEAHLVGSNRNQFNPVFGAGGTLGRRDFADVWCECRKKARPASKSRKTAAGAKGGAKPEKKSKAQIESEACLDATLFGSDTTELPNISGAGTWFVFANKAFNSGQGWSREGRISPWSFLLAAEGALLLVGDVNRRLSARARPYAAFPFISDPAQPRTTGEVGMSKGEFWAPLWNNPATIAEIRQLLKRGLARIGNQSAQAPHEFAIAALAAGTDAGVTEFNRFELRQTTSAKVYEAVPQEHIIVTRSGDKKTARQFEVAKLLSSLIPWLNRLPFEPRDAKQRGRFRGLRGPVEASIIQIGERPDEPERWRRLLLLLGEIQARIDRNSSIREKVSPLPRLSPEWFNRAWPEGFPLLDEIILARAIASVGAKTRYPILLNIFGIQSEGPRKLGFTRGDRPPRVVWSEGDPLRVFGQLLQRRLLDAEPGKPAPVGGTQTAPVETVARLLNDGQLDMERVATWVPALSLIDWPQIHQDTRISTIPHSGELLLFGLFRPIFHECPKRIANDWLPKNSNPALARRILHLIQFGDLDEAIQLAKVYYRAAGRSIVEFPKNGFSQDDFPARLSAALLVPLDVHQIQQILSRWLVPGKVTLR